MGQRVKATNGYVYERQPDGSMKRLGQSPEAEGLSPAEQYEAANMGGFRPQQGGIQDYIDVIMGASGLTGASSVQDQTNQRGSNTGAAADSVSEQGSEGAEGDDGTRVQEALNNGIPLEVLASGVLGLGVGAIAASLLAKRKAGKAAPQADVNRASAAPGVGTGTKIVDGQPLPAGQSVIDGTFDEIFGLPPRGLPAPTLEGDASSGYVDQKGRPIPSQPGDVAGWPPGVGEWGTAPPAGVDEVVPQGTQVPQLGDADSPNYRDQFGYNDPNINPRNVDAMIDETMYPRLDPDMEARAQLIAKQLRSGNPGAVSQISKMFTQQGTPDGYGSPLFQRVMRIMAQQL